MKKKNFEEYLNTFSEQTKTRPVKIYDISADLRSFRMVEISGQAADLGYAFGKTSRALGYGFPFRKKKTEAINGEIIALYQKIYPVHLEQMRGFAKAYGKSIEELDLMQMENSFFSQMGIDAYDARTKVNKGFGMCTVAAAQSPDKRVIIGRNLDTFNITGFLVRSNLEGVYKTLNTSGEAPHHFAVDGINEKGLFVGEMSITDSRYRINLSQQYPPRASIYCAHMIRVLLDTCANVEEALALFEKVPVWFTYDLWHYYLADAAGNVCIVEWDENARMQFYRGTMPLVSTNTAFLLGDEALKRCARYRIAKTALTDNIIHDHGDMYRVMKTVSYRKDNESLGDLVNDKKELEQMKFLRTVWTSTYDLERRSMRIRFHENGYKDIGLDFQKDGAVIEKHGTLKSGEK